jgi:DNA adenine methylase
MAEPYSPLRYPGGKASLSPLLAATIKANGALNGTYLEPYAGGAGAALTLLFSEYVSKVVINDADPCIYAFWWAILNRTQRFLSLIRQRPVSIREWKRQHEIYTHAKRYSRTLVGFATFYLNRCNRSGILVSGGPIGGYKQQGKWKLDARYNKPRLCNRIERIASYKDRIEVSNADAITLLKRRCRRKSDLRSTFAYIDPPYYRKGPLLYLNSYGHADHVRLRNWLMNQRHLKWVATYDNVPEIKSLYQDFGHCEFCLDYSAYNRRSGDELLIYSKSMTLPNNIQALLRTDGDHR